MKRVFLLLSKGNIKQSIIYEHFRLASIGEYDDLWVVRILILV